MITNNSTTQYIIEDVIIKDFFHAFVKLVDTQDQVDAYTLRKGKEINVIQINSEQDKKDYFVKAVEGLDSELSPENLHCDGEISHAEAKVKYRDIMSRLATMERESGLELEPLLQEA
jgi:hypothetical protein